MSPKKIVENRIQFVHIKSQKTISLYHENEK